MDTRLEDSFFESFRKINALQKEIEKEDKNSVFEDMERKRYDLISEYLFLGETEKTIVVLQKFIDANAGHLSFGGSMLTLQMFSTFIILLFQRGYTDRIDKYLDLFNKCASEMNGGFMQPFKESIVNYGKAFTAIIRKEEDKYDFCLDVLNSLEKIYEKEQDSIPLAFHISILDYKAACYMNMGDYESAITSLLKILSFEQEGDMIARRMGTLRNLSALYERKGDYKTALNYYNSFRSMDDDLYTTKNYAYSHFLIDIYGLSKQEIQTDMLIEGNKDLSGQILRDGMTGIYNRRFLHQLTEESFTGGNVWGAWGAIMFDIDFFKAYNDNYGHLAGDNVIVTFGNILKIYETSNIFPVRYGGEEFLLIVRGAGLPDLKTLAEQVMSQLRAFSIMHMYSGVSNIVTVSAGFSALSCGSRNDFERLIKESDMALYEAKHTGRNKVTEYRR